MIRINNPIHVDIDPDIETIDVDAVHFDKLCLVCCVTPKKSLLKAIPFWSSPSEQPTFITLEVIDQGTGMNATTMQTATTPFSGFEPPSSGLGLSLHNLWRNFMVVSWPFWIMNLMV